MQALIQTGILGTIPLVAALLFGWTLLIKALKRLDQFPLHQKHLIIQIAAILAFLTVRAFPESTGTFFSIDWLILCPLLLYFQLVDSADTEAEKCCP